VYITKQINIEDILNIKQIATSHSCLFLAQRFYPFFREIKYCWIVTKEELLEMVKAVDREMKEENEDGNPNLL
jgi:biotin synthase-like enzyme